MTSLRDVDVLVSHEDAQAQRDCLRVYDHNVAAAQERIGGFLRFATDEAETGRGMERDDLIGTACQVGIYALELVGCRADDAGPDAVVRHAEQQFLVIQVLAILEVLMVNTDGEG
jgi:hypothetical protein